MKASDQPLVRVTRDIAATSLGEEVALSAKDYKADEKPSHQLTKVVLHEDLTPEERTAYTLGKL